MMVFSGRLSFRNDEARMVNMDYTNLEVDGISLVRIV